MADVSDKLLERLTVVLTSLVPVPAAFVDPSTYQPGQGWVQIGEFDDLVERAGYRTVEQQVRELVAAGERLEDWRAALYPDVVVNGLKPVPVFADELEVLDRYRKLQESREEFKRSEEAEAALAAKADADAKAPPVPILVKIAGPPPADK